MSHKYVFFGYRYGEKGWKIYDIETNEYFFSRDVVLFDNKFLFIQQVPNSYDNIEKVVDNGFFMMILREILELTEKTPNNDYEGQDAQEMGEEDMSSIHDVEGNKSKIMNLNWIVEIE